MLQTSESWKSARGQNVSQTSASSPGERRSKFGFAQLAPESLKSVKNVLHTSALGRSIVLALLKKFSFLKQNKLCRICLNKRQYQITHSGLVTCSNMADRKWNQKWPTGNDVFQDGGRK